MPDSIFWLQASFATHAIAVLILAVCVLAVVAILRDKAAAKRWQRKGLSR